MDRAFSMASLCACVKLLLEIPYRILCRPPEYGAALPLCAALNKPLTLTISYLFRAFSFSIFAREVSLDAKMIEFVCAS